ncbi:MAG TPA: hypothetical protein VGW34_03425 [Allosphingosinicella sp.]|nr:hypothetical protein [Allosphingosinicella sp.]
MRLTAQALQESTRCLPLSPGVLSPPGPAKSPAELGKFARQLYEQRRLRDRCLSQSLFGEPAWDIMLDLFACEAEGKQISVSSSCAAAAVPATTALRYLDTMIRLGLIVRSKVAHDRRMTHVKLSPATHKQMTELLQRMTANSPKTC